MYDIPNMVMHIKISFLIALFLSVKASQVCPDSQNNKEKKRKENKWKRKEKKRKNRTEQKRKLFGKTVVRIDLDVKITLRKCIWSASGFETLEKGQ